MKGVSTVEPGVAAPSTSSDGADRPLADATRAAGALRRERPHPVYWVIATALVIIAVSLLSRGGVLPSTPAWAQPLTAGGSRGVFAFSGQLASGAYGVYMVDVDSMTIWCYEYQRERGCMRLAAARSWKYDRYLEQFNACDITPADVERLIEDQRAYKQSSNDGEP